MASLWNQTTFNSSQHAQWMSDNAAVAYAASAGYVILVLTGQKWMNDRPRMELRRELILWNLCLALFSISGAYFTISRVANDLNRGGFYYTLCNPGFLEGASGFWFLAFAWSKLFEFVDTAFVVLRKQKLIFLHWYHHALTFLLTWLYYSQGASIMGLCAAMNFFVHALMYSYYALRAARFQIPKQVQVFITILQILQMLVGCYLALTVYSILKGNYSYPDCHTSREAVYATFAMYLSYAVLFLNFFAQTYVFNKKKTV
eukprot:m.310537 g.310537  ORF g.310537 m.310537 type:complete len:259 (+) comp52358_c0_seq1:88-864(+)